VPEQITDEDLEELFIKDNSEDDDDNATIVLITSKPWHKY